MTELFRNSSPGALTRAQAVELAKKQAKAERAARRRMAEDLARQGRGEDTEIAHVARGEIVIPEALQNPEVLAAVRRAAVNAGVPLERLRVGGSRNSINPNTGVPEFGMFEDLRRVFWDERDPNQPIQAAQGVATRGAYTGINADAVRTGYEDRVAQIDPENPHRRYERQGVKATARQMTPPEVNAWIEYERGTSTDARPGSGGTANRADDVWSERARNLGRAGRALGALGLASAAYDVATADDKARAIVMNLGGFGGALLGGAGGAAAGTLAGPGAIVASPVTAVAGAIAGDNIGRDITGRAYDYVGSRIRDRRR